MRIRAFILTAIVLVFALSVCSCADRQNKTDEFEDLLLNTAEIGQDGEKFAEVVYLIISENASGEIALRAQKTADAISLKTGVRTVIKYDNEATSFGEGILEILVGDSSRLIARENFKRLRDGDYICRYDRGAIVLGGKDDSSTLLALDRFESEILPGASGASLMSVDANFEFFARDGYVDLVLNGYYVYDYKICFGDSLRELEIAKTLRSVIAEKSGYTIDLVDADVYVDSEERLINVALDPNANEGVAEIKAQGSSIRLCAKDLCGLSAAVAEFAKLADEQTDGGASCVEIHGDLEIEYSSELFSLTFVSAGRAQNTFDFLLDVADMLRAAQTPIICLGALQKELLEDVVMNIPDNYAIAYAESGSEIIPLIYDKEIVASAEITYGDGVVVLMADLGHVGEWRILSVSEEGMVPSLDGRSVAIVSELAIPEGIAPAGEFESLDGKYSVFLDGDSGVYPLLSPVDLESRTGQLEATRIELRRSLSEAYLELKDTVD